MSTTMIVLDDGRVTTLPLLEREVAILHEAADAAGQIGLSCAAHAFEVGALRRASAIRARLDFLADTVLGRLAR